jgi:hypothetical protein
MELSRDFADDFDEETNYTTGKLRRLAIQAEFHLKHSCFMIPYLECGKFIALAKEGLIFKGQFLFT